MPPKAMGSGAGVFVAKDGGEDCVCRVEGCELKNGGTGTTVYVVAVADRGDEDG